MMQNLAQIPFSAQFVNHFPGDETNNKLPRQTPGVLYSKVTPTPVKKPTLLAWSVELADKLGLNKPTSEEINILAGNTITPTMQPYSASYGGHQFGSWAGQLGDGRAITLGEIKAENGASWELQLKGAGPTPYSRRADGRAVLRSSVREYLMSEAMHFLGVPTTRALSLVSTGDPVMRDMFYDGHPAYEPGAIVLRAAPSFLRFGNFELLAARGDTQNLKKLVDWTVEKFYPHITGDDKIITWFTEVVDRTAAMIVHWLRVGFVHGVMNTDNMSVLGLTIDYGPYSFVDNYDPMFTPNTTDLPGRRYAFGRQAAVAKWNLGCLAGALAPLFYGTEALEKALDDYDNVYWGYYYKMMESKLGLDKIGSKDVALLTELEKVLTDLQPDMTLFYAFLATLSVTATDEEISNHFKDAFYTPPNETDQAAFNQFIKNYQKRVSENTISRSQSTQKMNNANPRFILRNYLLHQAIEELKGGKNTLFEELQQAMKEPYSDKWKTFFAKRPDWATQKAGCSMLSCSS